MLLVKSFKSVGKSVHCQQRSSDMCIPVAALSTRMLFVSKEMMQFNKSLLKHSYSRRFICVYSSIVEKYLGVYCNQRRFCSSKTSVSSDFPTTLTKQQAKELASKLTSEERETFLNALKECKSEEEKAGYEGQLAAFRWRSKFGRPSKILTLGDVDPTGTYCPVPDDWLQRKYVENGPEPTTKDLVLVAIANAIPFIGFGFLDNFIMIVAGDQIEMLLNRKFPISTMAAAALGNTVSDVIGIGSVHYVELFAQKVGFKAPKLSPVQLNLPKTRLAANMGRVFGVTIGCLIGMTPIPVVALFRQ